MNHKKVVMIIDDEKDLLNEIEEMLVLSGYKAHVYNTGDSALSALPKVKPDVIFLDLKMEGKDGFQVAQEIKEGEQSKHVPVFAMTGHYTDTQYTQLIKKIGVHDCLIKPVKPLDLIACIENLRSTDSSE